MTGAGIVDARNALDEAGGDLQKAVEILKKKGGAKAAKKRDRVTAEGVVASYIHHTRKLGALVEVQCETDFVARNEEFLELAQDIALQVAAIDPQYVSPETIPAEEVEKQREMFQAEMAGENKPEDIKAKIVEGKLSKWYSEVCLTRQPFLKNEEMTIEDLVNSKIARIGEKIAISRFTRYQL